MLMGRNVLGTVGIMGGVPMVHTEFCRAYGDLRAYTERHVLRPTDDILWLSTIHSYHATARNWLVDNALGEWLMMLDCDQEFSPNLVRRMLGYYYAHKLDVLTGVYYQRADPYMPVLWRYDADKDAPNDKARYQFITGIPDDRLVRIDAAGAGCLLVRRTVFDRVRAECGVPPFQPEDGMSEDFSFFDRCRRLGIKSYVAPMIETTHLMTRQVRREDHNAVAHTLRGVEVEAETLGLTIPG